MLLYALTRRDGGLKVGKQSRRYDDLRECKLTLFAVAMTNFRRRQRFKTYDDCVSGSHVVEWLLGYVTRRSFSFVRVVAMIIAGHFS
jgi:hypothetical protein